MEQSEGTAVPMAAKGGQTSGAGWKVSTVVAIILAICGILFGIYGMMQSTQKDSQIADLVRVQIKNNDGTVTAVEKPEVETTTGGETIVTIVDQPSLTEEEMQHYIYVAQWGLKIAVPETLEVTGYTYSVDNGFSWLAVSGMSCAMSGQCEYLPEFAVADTTGGLGGISRYPVDFDFSNVPYAQGEKILTLGGYDYYYEHPHDVRSTDPDEQAWELESVELIKEALTNPDNYSAI